MKKEAIEAAKLVVSHCHFGTKVEVDGEYLRAVTALARSLEAQARASETLASVIRNPQFTTTVSNGPFMRVTQVSPEPAAKKKARRSRKHARPEGVADV